MCILLQVDTSAWTLSFGDLQWRNIVLYAAIAQLDCHPTPQLLAKDPAKMKPMVEESLRRQVLAINRLADAGLFFWDYGNAFLLEARRAGADVSEKQAGKGVDTKFRYPSYVQDIMGWVL